jgi:hypothetical protein
MRLKVKKGDRSLVSEDSGSLQQRHILRIKQKRICRVSIRIREKSLIYKEGTIPHTGYLKANAEQLTIHGTVEYVTKHEFREMNLPKAFRTTPSTTRSLSPAINAL